MTFIQGIGLVKKCAKLCEYEEESPYYKAALRYIELARDALYREARKRIGCDEEGWLRKDESYADYNLLYAVVDRMTCDGPLCNKMELYWDLFLKRENVCE